MPRRLVLKSERLIELTPAELVSVNGGLPTQMCTGAYPTVNCTAILTAVTGVVTGVVTATTTALTGTTTGTTG